MAQAKSTKNDSNAVQDESAKGVGARDYSGTKTATSGATRVNAGAPEKQSGQRNGTTTDVVTGAVDNQAQPVLEQGPGAPGFITPAVGGIEGASFSAGGTPVTPVQGTVLPVIQDDDVPAGQSPVGQSTEGMNTDPKKTQNHSDRTKSVDSKKHK